MVHPGEPFYPGAYSTLAECNAACLPAESWNHAPGSLPCACYDPGDGSGTYATEAECLAAECGTPQPDSDDMPVGAIVAWPRTWDATTTSSTSQWLLCDGGQFDTDPGGLYADLAAILPDGNVPNLTATFVEGARPEGPSGPTDPMTGIGGTWPTSPADIDVSEINMAASEIQGCTNHMHMKDPSSATVADRCQDKDWYAWSVDLGSGTGGWLPESAVWENSEGYPPGGHGHYDITQVGTANFGHIHSTDFNHMQFGTGVNTGPTIMSAGDDHQRNTNNNDQANGQKGLSYCSFIDNGRTEVQTWGDYDGQTNAANAAIKKTDGSVGSRTKPASVVMNYIIKGYEDP